MRWWEYRRVDHGVIWGLRSPHQNIGLRGVPFRDPLCVWYYTRMQLLVTGGAGFIGNALILKLREEGHEVVCVDTVNEYYDPALKEARLTRLDDGVEVLRIDVTDKKALADIFKNHTFDVVCHLAAQAGVRYSLTHPDVYIESNLKGFFNILDCAKEYDVNHVVFASSSSVYGESTEAPFAEDAVADRPVSLYAATKRSGELTAHAYHILHGINVTCLRFFTVYGPYGRPDMAPILFTENILKGEPIDVYNNGNMQRDFTYIDDIVDGFVRAAHTPLGYEIINLGNGAPVHLMDFIGVLEKTLGKKAQKNMLPMQLGDVSVTYADTTKAKKLLGFEAKVTIEGGIERFVAWYKEYHKL